MIQPPLIPDPACTCDPQLCDTTCRGDCGCIACQCAYGEPMTILPPPGPRPSGIVHDGKCHPATGYTQLMEIARRAVA